MRWLPTSPDVPRDACPTHLPFHAIWCTLQGRNLVYCAPTSGGKSLVAEVLMLRRILTTNRPAMLVLPFVSICSEKSEHLRWGGGAAVSVGWAHRGAHHCNECKGAAGLRPDLLLKLLNSCYEGINAGSCLKLLLKFACLPGPHSFVLHPSRLCAARC